MNGIQKTPYVVPYIHSLTVTMEECHMENWQPMAQFIRVLQLLPNLRSLTILHVQGMSLVLINAFHGKIFPSVVSLSLSDQLAPILPCFPNVQVLTAQDSCIQLLGVAKKSCEDTSIHTINNIRLSPQVVESLRDAIPRVKQLSIWHITPLETMRLLEGMDNLADLRIRYCPPANAWNAQYEPALDGIIAAAKRVLRTSKAAGRKDLRIQHLEENWVHLIKEEQIFIVGGGQ
ncbi:hypothetical protein B0H17DRAFT_1100850 [Mycena rosella]|uniref:Uncharacterized protein n=1 Tax=Mycena rosella TaxID=1033263 RepID=A0AAD7CMB6_MYCRO|nr:hypothetical protein B0H17DRAFT_1100850 [Mycena rosella]